jgi:2-polyprenyl-6-methoxyphenol hydroxylase-like FAD-dependent oxidoreductase
MVGSALARRGHEVVAVDRDPGPRGESWVRRGVMQFDHAHNFRPQVPAYLQQEWPEAHGVWISLGAEPIEMPGSEPGQPRGMFSRRVTMERALRTAAAEEPGLTLRTGHVERLAIRAGRVVGAVVDGRVVEADLVVDASGRSGRVARTKAESDLDGDCGLAYVNRTYRLKPGAEPGPMTNPMAWIADLVGYQCLLFPHEAGHFSVVFIRPTADAALTVLHQEAAFDAACRAAVAAWACPSRAAVA